MRLRQFRDAAGLSQMGLARRLRTISAAMIANYESGRRTPTLNNALELARALGVTVENLSDAEG